MKRVFKNFDKTAYLEKGVFLYKKLLEKCIEHVEIQTWNNSLWKKTLIFFLINLLYILSHCMESLLYIINKTLDSDFNFSKRLLKKMTINKIPFV